MPTYKEYQEQISQLSALAEQARQSELADARLKVKALMQQHGLSVSDFAEGKHKSAPDSPKKTVPVKYKDPKTGATWTGRGREPVWLKGKKRDAFLIK